MKQQANSEIQLRESNAKVSIISGGVNAVVASSENPIQSSNINNINNNKNNNNNLSYSSREQIRGNAYSIETGNDVAVASIAEEEDLNFSEFISISDKEETDLARLERNHYYRIFTYISGVSYPRGLTCDSPFYFKIYFLISWAVRLFLFLVVALLIVTLAITTTETIVEKIIIISDAINLMTLVAAFALYYNLAYTKRSVSSLKFIESSDNLHFNMKEKVQALFKRSCYALLFFTVLFIVNLALTISFSLTNKANSVIAPLFSYIIAIIFMFFYFANMQKFEVIDVICDDCLEDIRRGSVRAAKFKASRHYIDKLLNSVMLPFSMFLCCLFLNLIPLLVSIAIGYNLNTKATLNPFFIVISIFASFSINLFLVFSICFRIADVNDKSAKITLEIAKCYPNKETLYVFQQQLTDPIAISIFGITLYRTQFILSVLSYILSVVIAIVVPRTLQAFAP